MTTLGTTKKSNNFVILLALVIGVAAAGGGYYLLNKRAVPTEFEIASFIGKPEIFSYEKGAWIPVTRGTMLSSKDQVRTGGDAEVEVKVAGQVLVRLKENSVLHAQAPVAGEQKVHRLDLKQGSLLASTEENYKEKGRLEVSTPSFVAAVRSTLFRIQVDPVTGESWIGVLRGQVDVAGNAAAKDAAAVPVRTLQRLIGTKDGKTAAQAERVTPEEWKQMKEVYELMQKSAAFEAKQMDLAKKAGSLFSKVFDHGTFFTPDFGFAAREFKENPENGEVSLEIEYDVFPTGSFSGVYFKTRDLDLNQYGALELEAKRDFQEGFPKIVRVELKSRGGIARAFNITRTNTEWEKFSFPFSANKETLITEIVFVFANDKVAEDKKGVVYLRNINLTPKPPTPTPAVAPPAPAAKTVSQEQTAPAN